MASESRRVFGFTLIELMVTIAVIITLMILALPSFNAFRQRSALRGATEQAIGFWNDARFESAKRNQYVKVGVSTSGTDFCLGAATTTTINDDTPCDCFTAGACNVAKFPTNQSEWDGVTYYTSGTDTPTLGTTNPVAVIEPKRGGLATPAQAGIISFADPTGGNTYRVHLRVNAFGKAVLCEATNAPHKMSDYTNRRCNP